MSETNDMTRPEIFEHYRKLYAESDKSAPKPHKGTLKIDQIKTLPTLFQQRDMSEDSAKKEEHIDYLAKAIKSGHRLDPIEVFAIDGQYYCIDGHHRLAAYKRSKKTMRVPIRVFKGSFEEAWSQTIKANSKDKLPMTQAEKMEATWRMTLTEAYSKKQIIETTRAGHGTVQRMRQTIRTLQEQEEAPSTMTWEEAQSLLKNEPSEIDDSWRTKRSRHISERLGKAFGCKLAKYDPEIVWSALEMYSEQMTKGIEDYLGIMEDEDENEEF